MQSVGRVDRSRVVVRPSPHLTHGYSQHMAQHYRRDKQHCNELLLGHCTARQHVGLECQRRALT